MRASGTLLILFAVLELTTPTAEAMGFFFANIPLTFFHRKMQRSNFKRTTLERKTVFQEGKVCANYAILLAILFIDS
jgi:hypothetical protein